MGGLRVPARYHERHSRGDLLTMSDDDKWYQMQRPILILRCVCPEIAAWTEEQWESGRLWFESEPRPYLACWWAMPHVLIINLSAMERSDAELATILAHEYRHSRQPMLRERRC